MITLITKWDDTESNNEASLEDSPLKSNFFSLATYHEKIAMNILLIICQVILQIGSW